MCSDHMVCSDPLVCGGGLLAVRVKQHDRPGQGGCQTEQAGAGLNCGRVEATISQEAARATGNQDSVYNRLFVCQSV